MSWDDFVDKIKKRKAVLGIIGLGQVGLPTALSFLKLGYKVLGYDINERLVRDLNSGKSHIPEEGFDDLLKKFMGEELFLASTSEKILTETDIVIICVATPLDSSGKADLSFLQKAVELTSRHLGKQKLIVVESTIPPRTMKDFVIPILEKASYRTVGKDFLVAFCPERIAPGNSMQEFVNNARIIGADDEESYRAAKTLYEMLTNGGLARADMTTAEISKLAENTYRDINIAFANELSILCEKYGVDVMDVIRLANTHPRVHIHRPGPGVGGPCLPKDPYLLMGGMDASNSLVKMARSINDAMPRHVVEMMSGIIQRHGKVSGQKIMVLGVSYKPNVNDVRYSPAQGIISALRNRGFTDITVHDPFASESFGAKFVGDLSTLSSADCVIVVTGHSVYGSLSPDQFKSGCVIIDAARVLDKKRFSTDRCIYVALGAFFPTIRNIPPSYLKE